MGNRHGHGHGLGHRKHSNAAPHNNVPPPYEYGTSNQPHQPPTHNSNTLSLPYAHVDSTLRALAGQAEGFGCSAIGGLHGPIHHVTSLADDGPGSLRDACRRKEPLWIVFDGSGTIHLSSYLNVSSYKTIDGRGHRIKLTGKGLRLKECQHVIICNLELEGGRGPEVDGIQIKPNSKHIWIDRCFLRDFDDGLIESPEEAQILLFPGVTFISMIKQCSLGQIPHMLMIDA